MDNRKDVPYIAFEAEIARLERIVHRSIIVTSIAVISLVVTNVLWIVMH